MIGPLTNGPIKFYGQVVDQHGQPVVGVDVSAKITYYPFISKLRAVPAAVVFETKTEWVNKITDETGKFVIEGRGSNLSLSLNKKDMIFPYVQTPSYERSHTEDGLPYSRPEDTYPIRAYKIGRSATKLIADEAGFSLEPDGRIYSLDLVTKCTANPAIKTQKDTTDDAKTSAPQTGGVQITIRVPRPEPRESGRTGCAELTETTGQDHVGDLEMQFKRKRVSPNDERFDWSVVLRAVDGGLIETYDALMYEAPIDGYQPEWAFDQRKSGLWIEWMGESVHRFYLKSRNGQVYAMILVEFSAGRGADRRPSMKLIYWANAEGSPTLYSTRTSDNLSVNSWPLVYPHEQQKLIAAKLQTDRIHADLDRMTALIRGNQENKAQSMLEDMKKDQRALYGYHAVVYEYLDVLGLMAGMPVSFWDSGTDNFYNAPPLVHAARIGYTEGVKRMLEHGAGATLSADSTPFLAAAGNAHNDIVQLLLAAGANVESSLLKNNCANRAMHFASEQGNVELIKLLIKAGADINVPNRCTFTPLHLAAQGTSLETVQLLLAAGADPNAPTGIQMSSRGNSPGMTPLFIAALSNRENLVAELARHSKKVDFTDKLWAGTLALKFQDLIAGIQGGHSTDAH